MIIAPYDPAKAYDVLLSMVLEDIQATNIEKEDDFLLMCIGSPGTGKSMLMLHVIEAYCGDKASIASVGLNRYDFANAIKYATKVPQPKICCNDEANVSKRDALSTYNKHLLDLYFSIRGLQIFHWWNNPSLDIIDKIFIKERIKGFIYIATKSKNKPRVYYYFRKYDLLRLYDTYKGLDINILHKAAAQYAYYKGWFCDYNGFLKEPYKKKKESRMVEKVDEFADTYGSAVDRTDLAHMAKQLCISMRTIQRSEAEMLQNGTLKVDEDFIISATGRHLYNKEAISKFKELANRKHEQRQALFKEGKVAFQNKMASITFPS